MWSFDLSETVAKANNAHFGPNALIDALYMLVSAGVLALQLAWLYRVYSTQPPVRSWDSMGLYFIYWAINMAQYLLACYMVVLPFKIVRGCLQAIEGSIEPARAVGRLVSTWTSA
ncbi:uncharacterized protein EHS24_004238 [Apiotrichum porosum]|uniref:Uncharacterized protein n=1 Tax=Apiotrichum porosum TaxID=105984 RepID=A0A427Y4N3_9TREE|nr:uncharacterized protein EHS24_004238 [Apiotrichum porosum]RSH86038.1 hypothetical protein EHS24_004238 [Apiotrichum porosum]